MGRVVFLKPAAPHTNAVRYIANSGVDPFFGLGGGGGGGGQKLEKCQKFRRAPRAKRAAKMKIVYV